MRTVGVFILTNYLSLLWRPEHGLKEGYVVGSKAHVGIMSVGKESGDLGQSVVIRVN